MSAILSKFQRTIVLNKIYGKIFHFRVMQWFRSYDESVKLCLYYGYTEWFRWWRINSLYTQYAKIEELELWLYLLINNTLIWYVMCIYNVNSEIKTMIRYAWILKIDYFVIQSYKKIYLRAYVWLLRSLCLSTKQFKLR